MGKYKGLCYPIRKHHQGFLHNTDDIAQIKGNIATIILTHPGERLLQPRFGTDLINVDLNQPKKMVANEFRQRIAKSIKIWEKRIQIQDIKADFRTEEEAEKEKLILQINVLFIDPFNLQETHEIFIEKSLGGIYGRELPF